MTGTGNGSPRPGQNAHDDAVAAPAVDRGDAALESSAGVLAALTPSRLRIRVCMIPMIRMHTTKTAGHIASTAKILRTGKLVARIRPAM